MGIKDVSNTVSISHRFKIKEGVTNPTEAKDPVFRGEEDKRDFTFEVKFDGVNITKFVNITISEEYKKVHQLQIIKRYNVFVIYQLINRNWESYYIENNENEEEKVEIENGEIIDNRVFVKSMGVEKAIALLPKNITILIDSDKIFKKSDDTIVKFPISKEIALIEPIIEI